MVVSVFLTSGEVVMKMSFPVTFLFSLSGREAAGNGNALVYFTQFTL